MIPTARYCKKHRKHFNPKDECPVCEAVRVLKGEDYEPKNRQSKIDKSCQSGSFCGDGCSDKGCSC